MQIESTLSGRRALCAILEIIRRGRYRPGSIAAVGRHLARRYTGTFIRVVRAVANHEGGVLGCRPDPHRSVVAACGEHEGLDGWVPGYAGQVAARRLRTDMMKQCC